MGTTKKYYLDTSVVYSLINHLDKFSKDEVFISLLVYWEIVSGVESDETFRRRKSAIQKIKKSKIRCYPYLKVECMALAYSIDLSEHPVVSERKKELWNRVKILLISNSYDEYMNNLKVKDIEIEDIMKFEKKQENDIRVHLSNLNKQQAKIFKEQAERRLEEPEYYTITPESLLCLDKASNSPKERIKETLHNLLTGLRIEFTDEDFNKHLIKYDDSLTQNFIGLDFYAIKRGCVGEEAQRNDYTDLGHLLYLRSENDIIVSNDNIYEYSTLPQQRMRLEEFKLLYNI